MKIKDFKIAKTFDRVFMKKNKIDSVLSYENFKIAKKYFKSNNSEDIEIFKTIDASLKNNKFPFDITPQEERFLKNHENEKWVDYLIYRYKMKVYPLINKTANFPVYLCIEPVSSCNLRCVMCFQSDKSFTKKPFMGVMKLDLFKKVIDEASAGGTKAITLASRGEPTMNKNIAEMIEYTKGKFFDVKLNTNGTRLTEDLCHKIIQSGITELVFSIDAENKDLYEKIRLRGKFDNVIENIKMFHRIRKEYPSSLITTTASGVFFHEEQNIESFTKYFEEIVDNVAAVKIQNRWNTYANNLHPDLTSPCNYLWERMYVWFDGKCNPCDVDYKSMLQVGDITQNSISEIWHGTTYKKIRADHIEKKRSIWNPCDRCGVG